MYTLFFIRKLILLSGTKISSAINVGSSILSAAKEIEKCLSILDKILFNSSIANFWPIQFRGPALNGIYAKEFIISFVFSTSCRSGQKFNGSGNVSAFRPIQYIGIMKLHPAGYV